MKLPDAIQARATALRAAATRRWLVKDELVFLLKHHAVVGVPLLHALQLQPPSGTLLFYNTREVSDYKKDGWRWQKRTDKTGRVREDRAKLVINRAVIVLGTYVHSEDTATFHRRIYSIRDSEESIVLVHYFDEANKEAVASPRSLHAKHKANASAGANNGVKRSLPATHGSDSSTSFTPSYPTLKTPLPEESVDSIMKNCFDMDFDPHVAQYQEPIPMPGESEMELLLKNNPMDGLSTSFDADGLLFHEFDPTTPSNVEQGGTPPHFELAGISDFSPDWDFGEGGAKILICLATKLPEELAQDPVKLFVQFGTTRVRAEKVSETVLRCTAPASRALGSVELFVCHCHNALDSQSIQLSLKTQFTYRSHHQVSPSLTGDGSSKASPPEAVGAPDALNLASASLTHGTSHGTGKRGRSPTVPSRVNTRDSTANDDAQRGPNRSLSSYVESDLDERQCKIRVVERLSEFQKAIWTKVTEPTFLSSSSSMDISGATSGPFNHEEGAASMPWLSHFSLSAAESEVEDPSQPPTASQPDRPADPASTLLSSSGSSMSLDDCTIEALSDKDLEQLSEKLLERVVRQLITVAYTSEELLEELNSLDETGLSLLHYVSFYNYAQLVPVLLAHGAHINQQSTQGQTALHLAAGCGHQEVVDVLLDSGVDLAAHDFDGLTAADRAEKSGHADVAAKLRRHMGGGEAAATDAPAPDEIFGFGDSPMEIDDAPSPYVDAGDMGLLEDSAQPWPPRSHSSSCGSPSEAGYASKAPSYAGENQEHNRKLLLGAFSTMSLHDKCALSLSISRDSSVAHGARRRESSVGDEPSALWSPASHGGGSSTATSVGLGSSPASMVGLDANLVAGRLLLSGNGDKDAMHDSDVKSVLAEDEASLTKLQAAMELMGPEERQSLEEEVKVLQHNIRAWLLKRNCKHMRETTQRLREATRSIADQQIQQQEAAERRAMLANELSQRERAAVTLQAATRSILARRSFLQTRHVAIKVQAATRGVLCRKNFARMKAHALASLVIQRNVREWWHKQPAAGTHASGSGEDDGREDKPRAPEAAEPTHGP